MSGGIAALTAVGIDLSIRIADTGLDDKDIRGRVNVTAPDVVIRRSKIRCTKNYAILSTGYSGTSLLIEDSEIDCKNDKGAVTRVVDSPAKNAA